MMGPDEDLPTLIHRQDHLNVLRYVRAHQLRDSELVLSHGTALLGPSFTKRLGDESARLAALEQVCLAALDVHNHDAAEACLAQLKNAINNNESSRFRRLVARCLEASGDFQGAQAIYDSMLQENPANLVALQRKYCLLKAQPKREDAAVEALNLYLQQNLSDTAGWYELAQLRMNMADYKGAAYALEEVVLSCPLESPIHCELAEVYATIGGLDNLKLARKHMAQALELDSTNRRAQFGLVTVANSYLLESQSAAKKFQDEHEVAVSKELIKYGAELLLKSYQGCPMFPAVKMLMEEYTTDDSSST